MTASWYYSVTMVVKQLDDWPLPGDPNEKIGTQQHIVPQAHLRYFADEKKQIEVLDRQTGKRFLAPTSRPGSAVERDFNTFINLDGALDGRLDHLLTYIEGRAVAVMRKLVEGGAFVRFPPSDADREDMCIFLAFQLSRGRKTRRQTELIVDLYARMMIPAQMSPGQAETLLRARGGEITPETVADLVALSADLDQVEFIPDPNEHLALMGPLAQANYRNLITRAWYLIEYAEPSLLTCDEPVVLDFADNNPLRGLSNADEVWFPLSPTRLLVLARRQAPVERESRLVAPEGSAAEVNSALAVNAYQQIYAHPAHKHLDHLTIASGLPLFKVSAPESFGLARFNKPPVRWATQRRNTHHPKA